MFRPPTIGAPAAAGGPIIDFSAKGGRKQAPPRTHARNVVTLKAKITLTFTQYQIPFSSPLTHAGRG